MEKICKRCGKKHDGSYGSGKFCSQKCAYYREATPEFKKKVSEAVKNSPKYREAMKSRESQHNPYWLDEWRKKGQKERWLKRNVTVGKAESRVRLDITNEELLEYRKTHPVCEICGKPEDRTSHLGKTYSLAVDHDHDTNHFRGLLCKYCNTRLGIYEMYKETFEKYLNERR